MPISWWELNPVGFREIIKEKDIQCNKGNQIDHLIEEKAITYLANFSDGDARTALNCLEISYQIAKERVAEMKICETSTTITSDAHVITVDDIKR